MKGDRNCTICGGSGVEEVYGGHGTVREFECAERTSADDPVMVVCDVCGGDGSFDKVVGHDPSGPVWQDSFCSACQGAGEYAVKREPITIDDLDEIEG